jgi:hypothetical protein
MQEERVFGAADEEEYIETVARAQQEIEESQRLRVVDEDGSKGEGGWRYKTAQKDREERSGAREVEQVGRDHGVIPNQASKFLALYPIADKKHEVLNIDHKQNHKLKTREASNREAQNTGHNTL